MHTLTYEGSSERIDTWLTSQFPYSRNFFQHIIERGGVRVATAGGTEETARKVKKSYKLQAGDIVWLEELTRFLDGGILEECPAIELDIRHEDDDYLVLYKPKGVLSHPNSVRDVQHPSVVGGLYHHFQAQGLPTMGSFVRAGLIHRLDKETDGLMLIAKTEQGLAHFKTLFQRKSEAETIEEKEAVPLKKYYRAISRITLLGEGFVESITDKFPYLIDELVKPRIPHLTEFKQGLTKVLSVNDLSFDQQDALAGETDGLIELDLEILTGRTHQIRYHLSNHGLPIIGDYLYGVDDGNSMQLTAWKIGFEDLGGMFQEISV